VFPGDYETPSYLTTLQAQAVTHAGLPPAHLALLIAALREDRIAFPALRHLRLMGGTPSPALVEITRRRFSTEIHLPYAIGEIGVVSMATPDIVASVPGCSGRIAPGARVELRDESGAPCAAGSTGDLRVAIEGMPTGYFGPDADAPGRFRDGWFQTGDRARLTPEGLLFIEGRSDDLLNVGGRKAAPAYIERTLEEHPGVREAAVFAVGEGLGGTQLAAAIVVADSLDWAALHRYARARLGVLAPLRYYEARTLPRNDMGKLERTALAPSFREAPAVVAAL
jgi:acyl-coenzyme A synthetase/AMP-(fatty) acid ligase